MARRVPLSPPAFLAHLSSMAALEDHALDIGGAAMDLAALRHPKAKLDPYYLHLDSLASQLSDFEEDGTLDYSGVLHTLLSDVYGYSLLDEEEAGDWETDLMETIDSRLGTAETLGILTLEVLRRAGWRSEALAFAPSFLIRIYDDNNQPVIVDPASGWQTIEAHDMRALVKAHFGLGAELTPDQHAPISNRAVLLRLQASRKLRHLRAGRLDQALDVVEQSLLFAPAADSLWREAAILHSRLNHFQEAITAWEEFLARCQDRTQRAKAQQMLADLRQHLN